MAWVSAYRNFALSRVRFRSGDRGDRNGTGRACCRGARCFLFLRTDTRVKLLVFVMVSAAIDDENCLKCSLSNAEVMPSGEIGKVLSQALDLNGRLRSALHDGLTTLCGGR
jgi:hypothetical protein